MTLQEIKETKEKVENYYYQNDFLNAKEASDIIHTIKHLERHIKAIEKE